MFSKIKITTLVLAMFSLGIVLVGFLEAKAADPITLSNNYEIAVGSNIDSATDNSGNTFVVYERSGSIYLTKNRDAEVLIGSGSNPALSASWEMSLLARPLRWLASRF